MAPDKRGTAPEKFAPLARSAIVIRARHFGADEMAGIPLRAVENAIEETAILGLDSDIFARTSNSEHLAGC